MRCECGRLLSAVYSRHVEDMEAIYSVPAQIIIQSRGTSSWLQATDWNEKKNESSHRVGNMPLGYLLRPGLQNILKVRLWQIFGRIWFFFGR